MNLYYLIAGILCFILGLVHSILGETMIFKNKRNKGSIVPSKKGPDLREGHLRIIWSTWHLASVFGWCLGFILIKVALADTNVYGAYFELLSAPILLTMFLGSALVLIGTKGKHPGWIVLLLIGVLIFLGS